MKDPRKKLKIHVKEVEYISNLLRIARPQLRAVHGDTSTLSRTRDGIDKAREYLEQLLTEHERNSPRNKLIKKINESADIATIKSMPYVELPPYLKDTKYGKKLIKKIQKEQKKQAANLQN